MRRTRARERKRKIVARFLSFLVLSPSLYLSVVRQWSAESDGSPSLLSESTCRISSVLKKKRNHYLDAVGCPNEKMYTYDQLDQSEPFISMREQWRETPVCVCSASRTRYYTCLMEKKRRRGMGNVLLSHSFIILWIHAKKCQWRKREALISPLE